MFQLLASIFLTLGMGVHDTPDHLRLYRQLLEKDDWKNYVLSFEATMTSYRNGEVHEKTRQSHVLKVRGQQRYASMKIEKPGKPAVQVQGLMMPDSVIEYDPRSPHLEFFNTFTADRNDRQLNVDHRTIGRLPINLGIRDQQLPGYLDLFDLNFIKTRHEKKESLYVASGQKGLATYTLVFAEDNPTLPVQVNRVFKYTSNRKVTYEHINRMKFKNDKTFAAEVEYIRRENGEMMEQIEIRNIKIAPLPAEFVFSPTLLNIPINAKARVDRFFLYYYWNGKEFVEDPVPGK